MAEDIIEEVRINPQQYSDFIFIPHRPVFKNEAQVTTRVRPVFNCSLQIKENLPSLNQAAYTGIDMLNSIFKVLLQFRSNQIVLLSDIRKAFLMIRLRYEADKNRFCFFWMDGDTLNVYRFKL